MNKKKQILMLLSNGFEPDPRVYKEAKTLVKNNYDVTIWCLDRNQNLKKKEEMNGIKILRFRVGKTISGNMLSMAKSLKRFKKIILKTFQKQRNFVCVHCHDLDTAIIGMDIQNKFGTKFIFDCHDLYYTQVHRDDFIGKVAKKGLKNLELKVAKKADWLITATEGIGGKEKGLKEHFVTNRIKGSKITTIWNYPEKSFRGKRKSHKNFNISFIGSVRFLRGFELVFKALERIKDKNVRVQIVGSGVYLDKLKKLSEKYSVKTKFLGFKPYKEMPKIYSTTDLMITLYDKTNQNIKRAIAVKQFESLQYGIPTLVDKNTLHAEFVTKYKVGIPISTVPELVRAIKYIKGNYSKYSKNINRIGKNYVWESQENKLLEIYKKVLR